MIMFSNLYYKLSITDGIVTLLDVNNSLLATMSYQAIYGFEKGVRYPLPSIGSTYMYIRDSVGLSVDDIVDIGDESLIGTVYFSPTITGITPDGVDPNKVKIDFSIPFPSTYILNNTASQVIRFPLLIKKETIIDTFLDPEVTTSIIQGGTLVQLTCSTSVGNLIFSFYCYNNNKRIKVTLNTTYTSNVEILNEKIIFTFEDTPSFVLSKNRKLISIISGNYWLGNQGCIIGEGSRSICTYNNIGCTSVELLSSTKQVIFNLDNWMDHRFRTMEANNEDYSTGVFTQKNTSVYTEGQSRINSFNFYISNVLTTTIPRLMHSPNGFLTSFVFDSHADGINADQIKALCYGDSTFTTPTMGILGNGLTYTQNIHYTEESNAANKLVIQDLYSKGIDIGMHSYPIYYSSSGSDISTKIPLLQSLLGNYNMKHCADHAYKSVQDDLCTYGVDNTKLSYMKDVWDTVGIKSFGTVVSEDTKTDKLDVLGGSYQDRRSPLYWKHPTRIGNFIISAQYYGEVGTVSPNWSTTLTEANLNSLIDNMGVFVAHCYLHSASLSDTVELNGSKYIIKPTFEIFLNTLKSHKLLKNINITCMKDLISYWDNLEDIEIHPDGVDKFTIINNGDTLCNVSFIIDDKSYDIYEVGYNKINYENEVTSSYIYSVNMEANTSKEYYLCKSDYNSITASDLVNIFNNGFNSLNEIVDKEAIITNITISTQGTVLIATFNSNITELNTYGTGTTPIFYIGISGKKLIELFSNYQKNFIISN